MKLLKYLVLACLLTGCASPKQWTVDASFNQYVDGPCIFFALANAVVAEPYYIEDMTYNEIFNAYREAKAIDNIKGTGTSFQVAFELLSGPEYHWFDDIFPVYSVYELALALENGPVVIGMVNLENVDVDPESGIIVPHGEYTGSNHAVLCIGYDYDKEVFDLYEGDSEFSIFGSDIFHIRFHDLYRVFIMGGQPVYYD